MKKTKQIKPQKFKVGGTAVMLFHYAGLVSEEKYKIVEINGDILTMDTDEDGNGCFKFHMSTGACINDSNRGGAYRKLKL